MLDLVRTACACISVVLACVYAGYDYVKAFHVCATNIGVSYEKFVVL